MANAPVLKGIKNSMSLKDFAKSHGKMKVGQFSTVDQETGEKRDFKSCVFENPTSGALCFVAFSSRLGELTSDEIKAKQDQLQVAELEGGHYSLCMKGSNAWEDVDLDF